MQDTSPDVNATMKLDVMSDVSSTHSVLCFLQVKYAKKENGNMDDFLNDTAKEDVFFQSVDSGR